MEYFTSEIVLLKTTRVFMVQNITHHELECKNLALTSRLIYKEKELCQENIQLHICYGSVTV